MTDLPAREEQRLAALAQYDILDTPREKAFDDLAALVAAVCEAPIAVVNLIGDGRQFFKAEVGLGVRETPLSTSFCAHAILEEDFLLVPDATQDPRFACNPLVTGEPHLRFYAGALLKSPDGLPIGTLCVLDYRPRDLSDVQRRTIRVLADQVMTQLEHRIALRQIAASESRQRAIVESARDFAIIATDIEGRITDWNSGAEAILGWSADEMHGEDASCYFTLEDRAADRPAHEMRLALANGRAPDDRWHLKQGGERFWASGEMMPLHDGAGEHLGFVKILRDRTSEHLAGVALEETQERYRLAAEATNDAVWDWDFATNQVAWNAALSTAYGHVVDDDKSTGDWWIAQIHADDRDRIDRSIHAVIDGEGTAWSDEYRFRRADGSYANVLDRGHVIRDAQGRATRMIGAMLDLTRIRMAEDALRDSEEQLRLATEGAEVGLWDVDLLADTLYWPARVKAMFGISADVPITMADFYAGLHPEDRERVGAAFLAAADPVQRAVYDVEYRTIGKEDGIVRWVAAKGRGVFDEAGQCRRVLGTAIDITARKAVERQLHELNERLEQRVAEEVAERAKAEEALRQSQKMEAVGQLTGGIAHDFNNMLTGVIGSLDLIQRNLANGRSDRVTRYLDAATTSAQRAAALTARLLAFGRRQSLDLVPVDVNALVSGLEDLLHRTLGEQVSLETNLSTNLWTACSDSSQLENAIVNLCINARDAMPDGGKLTIETANAVLDAHYAAAHPDVAPGDYVVVSVSDTGTGMSAETLEKVFEPFFTTKPIGQGTGLGLSMIYGFARQSEGHVRLYSELGQGTSVKLYLPRHHGDVVLETGASTSAPRGAGETVMIVEDDPSVRLIVLEVLEELGYAAIEAVDGRAAIPILQSDRRIDLLVTDVGLPGLNGRQLAEIARETRPDLGILFITGYAQNAAVRGGFLAHGMEMLTKPFAIEALATKIREMLER